MSTQKKSDLENQATPNNVETKKDVSREDKKQLRRAQLDDAGPLHLDDKFKREGFRYRAVNVVPGNIQKWENLGARIVSNPDAVAGNGSVDTSHSVGASFEINVGRKYEQKAVWMEMTEEDYQIYREIEDDKAKEQAEMINNLEEIPEQYRIGKITKEK